MITDRETPEIEVGLPGDKRLHGKKDAALADTSCVGTPLNLVGNAIPMGDECDVRLRD